MGDSSGLSCCEPREAAGARKRVLLGEPREDAGEIKKVLLQQKEARVSKTQTTAGGID